MSAKAKPRTQTQLLGHNPLEGEQLLLDALYGKTKRQKPPESAPSRRQKPQHYKIISISLYNEDIERLENMVQELKDRGHHKANKSQLIRQALMQLDLDKVQRSV